MICRILIAWAISLSVIAVPRLAADEPAASPLSPEQTTRLGELLESDWEDPPPWAQMATAILKGGSMGSGTGWFTASLRRHDWNWLAMRYPEAAADESIGLPEIPGLDQEAFARLDQDRDRAITPADFVFDKNPLLEDESPAGAIFGQLDNDSNGRLTREELERWFQRSSDGTDFLSIDDLKDALGFGPKPPRPQSNSGENRADPRWNMLGMLLNGEMGSFNEGPNLGDDAPELNLPLVAVSEETGKLALTDRSIRLEDFRGKKPVVLIFGSFT